MNYSYSYDLAGNRTLEQVDASVTGSTFNNLNQVTAQSPGGSMEFTGTVNEWATITLAGRTPTVDANGNWRGTANVTVGANAIPLVATDINANTTTKSINVAVSGGASRALAYDLNGNLTNDGAGKTYTYDAVNRLITVTQNSNVTTFVYNGLGQRVQEKLNGTLTKQLVWRPSDAQPAEERDGSNAVTKRFYGLGEQIGGVAYFFTADHLGSVREMTDSTGAIRARYDYDPYGRITKLSGDLETDFGFTGFYHHQTSGLNLTLYRAYDANLGRWLSRDPIGEAGGINRYGYVSNNPINAIDPLGLDTYIVNRWLSAFGVSSSASRLSLVTHTFVATTNPDGSINHTYSWGNDANLRGWNLDQPLDLMTAQQAISKGQAQHVGADSLDPFVAAAFAKLNKPENEHTNLIFAQSCKGEAHKLVATAKQKETEAAIANFFSGIFNFNLDGIPGRPRFGPSFGPPTGDGGDS